MLQKLQIGSHCVSRAAFLQEAVEENLFLHLSQLLEGACFLWLVAPSTILAAQHLHVSN